MYSWALPKKDQPLSVNKENDERLEVGVWGTEERRHAGPVGCVQVSDNLTIYMILESRVHMVYMNKKAIMLIMVDDSVESKVHDGCDGLFQYCILVTKHATRKPIKGK